MGDYIIYERLALGALSLPLGFFCCIHGWKRIDDKRIAHGAAIVGCGFLLGIGGPLLWFLTFVYPASQGWPL